jgi:hypothetical protein
MVVSECKISLAVFLHDLKNTALLVVGSQKTMTMKMMRKIAIF